MVLEENSNLRLKREDKVTRICDECRKSQHIRYDQILEARKNKKEKADYCKKCSYKHRKLNQPTMEKSPSWNGGRYLNENGYYRVYSGSANNNKYIYEHKLIYENFLGRKLSVIEKVHHIDGNKSNNEIENLFLCENKAKHYSIHQSMEDCAIAMLDKGIWYDFKNKAYTTEKKDRLVIKYNEENIKKILLLKTYKEKKKGRNKAYIHPTSSKLYPRAIHIMIAEEIFNKKILKGEVVHHINGDSEDNSINNLAIMNKAEHKRCHYSLQECIKIFFNMGKIRFINGQYIESKEEL